MWFGLEKLIYSQNFKSDMLPESVRNFLFMPWVFLLTISIGGSVAGVFGYFAAMGLIVSFYLQNFDIIGMTM